MTARASNKTPERSTTDRESHVSHMVSYERAFRLFDFAVDVHGERVNGTETSNCNVASDWSKVWADLPRLI